MLASLYVGEDEDDENKILVKNVPVLVIGSEYSWPEYIE